MHLMKIVFVEESIAAWSVVREKFQPLYILMQTINFILPRLDFEMAISFLDISGI